MVEFEKTTFDAADFLAKAGLGRRIVELAPKQPFFSQGDPADSVFYLQKGRAKMTVVSRAGKEATILMLSPASLSAKARWQRYLDCACPRQLRSPPAVR